MLDVYSEVHLTEASAVAPPDRVFPRKKYKDVTDPVQGAPCGGSVTRLFANYTTAQRFRTGCRSSRLSARHPQ